MDQLQHALDSRIVTEQAKGMISERARVDMDEAFSRLRHYARSHQVHLIDVARQVTAAGPILDELAAPKKSGHERVDDSGHGKGVSPIRPQFPVLPAQAVSPPAP